MSNKLDIKALNQLFLEARTLTSWQEKEVSDETLKEVYNVAKMGATAANCQPMRVVFVKSKEQKERLKKHLVEGNIEKTMTAPATAIVAIDKKFYEHLDFLFPFVNARSWYEGNQEAIDFTSFLNTSLQGAYLMIAARAMGLDCGPMSGFDKQTLDEDFFKDTSYKSLFLCNLGYGKRETLQERAPRFEFNQACKII